MQKLILFLLLLLPICSQAQIWRVGDITPDSVPLHGAMQGLAIRSRYAVTLRHGGQCTLYDLRRGRMVANYQLSEEVLHCNNANFDRKGNLYLSSCYGDRHCYVYSLFDHRKPTTPQLLRTLYFDAPLFAQDWVLDAERNELYAYHGKQHGTLYLKRFSSCSRDTLTTIDIVDSITITCVDVPQGSKVFRGYAYLPDGDEPGQYKLHIIRLKDAKEMATLNLNNPMDPQSIVPIYPPQESQIPTPESGVQEIVPNLEPEGIDVDRRHIYISFHATNPSNDLIIRLEKKRVQGRLCK